jgi:hypothetical protein
VSNGIDFTAPDAMVEAAQQRKPSEDRFAEEIYKSMQVKDETLVRARVGRGDNHQFTSARKTIIVYQDEPWPGPGEGKQLPQSPSSVDR